MKKMSVPPGYPPPTVSAPLESGSTTEPRGRLLVIDDEPAALKIVKLTLTRAGYVVVGCETGSDALKLLREETFDCVVTDAMMPVVSGYDLTRAMRRDPELTDLPVLMLTRKRHRQDVKKAVDAGVTDYILKPLDEHLLLGKVDLCIKKGGGKRFVFQCPIMGQESKAEIRVVTKLVSISETDLTLRSHIPLSNDLPYDLTNKLFSDIGINAPYMRIVSCEDQVGLPSGKEYRFEIKLSFIGVIEDDLKKIRAWIQKQAIQNRK